MGTYYEVDSSTGRVSLLGTAIEDKILFNDGTDTVKILIGSADPVSTSKDADIGSIYIRSDVAGLYIKQDDGPSANWGIVSADATLDDMYDSTGSGVGRAIIADSGAVTISVSDDSNNRCLEITQNDITNNPNAMLITNAGTGTALSIDHNGATGTALEILSSVERKLQFNDGTDVFSILTGTTDPTSVATNADVGSLYVNTSTAKWYVKLDDNNTTNWSEVDIAYPDTLDISYDGSGSGAGRAITADSGAIAITVPDTSNNAGLEIAQNDTTNNPTAISITNAGTGTSLYVDHNGATGTPLLIEATGTLKMSIDDGTDEVSILTGTTDPTSSAPGVVAGIGSLYINSNLGMIYIKHTTDANDTNWNELTDGNTLDSAYDEGGNGSGRTVTADSGAVAITVSDTSSNEALVLTQNDVTNNPSVLSLVNAGTGNSLAIDHNGATGVALAIESLVETKMTFDDDTDTVSIVTGTDNPMATSKNADIGSLYIKTDTREMYQKTDDGDSTSWEDIRMPKTWTTAGRPSGDALYEGIFGYNTTTKQFEGYNGDSEWVILG